MPRKPGNPGSSDRGKAAKELEQAREVARKLGKKVTEADRDRVRNAERAYDQATEQERRDGGRASR